MASTPGIIVPMDVPQGGLEGGKEQWSTTGGSNPKQYALPPGAKELQDLIEYRGMNFAIGNMFKACYRMGECDHSEVERDLEKIIFFAKRELDRVRGGAPWMKQRPEHHQV